VSAVLAILTTHPIQYQVPIWKKLAVRKNVPFTVLYMDDRGAANRFDPGFGAPIRWDIDLLSGYDFHFLGGTKIAKTEGFFSLRLKSGFSEHLHAKGTRVLWIQGWQVAGYWQAAFRARSVGCKLWLRGETNDRSNGAGRKPQRVALRHLFRRVDKFLCIGEANRRFYLQQGVEEGRLASAPYCVDNDRFAGAAAAAKPERTLIRRKWGIPDDAFCFSYVGKFIAKKRPFDLIEAAAALMARGLQVHILWIGTGELGAQLRQRCDVVFDAEGSRWHSNSARPRAPRASFVGFLNQSQVHRAYVAADCLVLPSDARETWGLVVNEALACGLPCIVSNACGCADDLIAPKWPKLVYPVSNTHALEASMARIIENSPSSIEMGEQASRYSVDRTVEAVERLYNELE
jgi:glycosyltransferase involved in cell wall biosynthesis